MDGEKRKFDNVVKSKERLLDVTREVASSPENMIALLNDSYDEKTLQVLKDYYSNYCSEEEWRNKFNDNLDALFNRMNFNTKTKKSELYNYLNIHLINIELVTHYNPTDRLITLADKLEELGEEFSFNINQLIMDISMVGRTLEIAIKYKVVCKYRHLLPKRFTNSFKEEYRWLYDAIVSYETLQANKTAEERYIQIHNNEGISDIIQNLHHCNEVNQDEYRNVEVKYITPKGSLIELDVDTGEGINIFDIAEQVNDLIGATQSQLIVYIMSLVFEQNEGIKASNYWKVDIDVKEYCKLKGIDYESKVANAIYEDIKNLQRIIIQYEYTNSKGKKDILEKSSLFANRGILTSYGSDNVTIEKQVVGVALGKWIETLKVDQFQFINKAFFKYKLRNNKGTIIPISYYINCQHRNNLKRAKGGANEFKIKVGRLSNKLGIDEDRVKSKGYSSTLKKPLEKILNDIKEAEGFNWSYKNGNHNSRKDFEEDVIIFKNTDLDSHYNSVGYEKKETKSKK